MDRAVGSKRNDRVRRPGLFLLTAALKPDTQKRYRNGVVDFLKWCVANGEQPHTAADLDECLCEYIHFMYNTNQAQSRAAHTLYGIVAHLPSVRDHLPTSARALAGWHKLEASVPYPPLTWELAVAIAVRMMRRGARLAAIGVLVAFDCLLRVGELCGLRKDDVVDARSGRLGGEAKGVALRLANTKTGPNKFVIVEDPQVARLLLQVCAQVKASGPVFPFTTGDFRKHFKAACAELGLSNQYVPHSLRHGGATRLDLRGVGVEDIMKRGRWASTKSARHYIQSGKALRATMTDPPLVRALGAAYAGQIHRAFTLTQMH